MEFIVLFFFFFNPPHFRFLEEGNIEEAETQKQRIEQLQRERRRVLEENCVEHQPRFFRCVPPDRPGRHLVFPVSRQRTSVSRCVPSAGQSGLAISPL